MRHFLVFMFLVTILFCFSETASAFTTTLDFFGGALYDVEGVKFPQFFVPDLDTQTWGKNNLLRERLNFASPYYGVGAIDYRFCWDLPNWNTVYPWYLDVDIWGRGAYTEINSDEIEFSKSLRDNVYLGSFSLYDIFGASKTEAIDYIANVPKEYYDPGIGGYFLDGNLRSGQFYFALEGELDDILSSFDIESIDLERAEIKFGGRLALNTIPEPATMSLLGLGILGLAGFRKKK